MKSTQIVVLFPLEWALCLLRRYVHSFGAPDSVCPDLLPPYLQVILYRRDPQLGICKKSQYGTQMADSEILGSEVHRATVTSCLGYG